MKRKALQWLAAATALVFLAVILTRGLAGEPAHQLAHQPARPASTAKTAVRVKVAHENGQVVIQLVPRTQARLGIAEAPLKAARERKQMAFPARVLPVENLQTLVSAYDAVAADLQKAEITASVTQREYQRLKKLYGDQQNVSAKAVQSAAGVYRGDEVDVRLARQNLSLAAAAVRQSWGEAITGWLAHNTAQLGGVLCRDDVLVEMTLPPGEPFAAPSGVEFNLPAGGLAFARFVSAYPQVDPRVQGVGYLYITRARPGLAPGLNLIAHFGVGALTNGVIVPSSAVVWLHGDAWAYVATGPGRFVRRRVSSGIPAPGGWFVTQGFAPGSSVVTRDAEQILSVEIMASQPALGKGKGSDD